MNQLAEKYLDRKQGELGQRIPHAAYADELQKVRHYIADRNVYGVDLNPVALELAEVSLWLNCIHKGRPRTVVRLSAHVRQLAGGGEAAGVPECEPREGEQADRAVVQPGAGTGDAGGCGQGRSSPAGAVYHFLLPDPGMADYPRQGGEGAGARQHGADWEVAEGTSASRLPPSRSRSWEALSDRVDALWATHTEQLARDHRETEDTIPVWGQPAPARERRTTNTWKDRIRAQGIFSEGTRTASPYRRLKLVMDYWCALWFWPIEAADRLPDRDAFLNEIALVLTGSVYQPDLGPNQTADLFGEEYAEHAADIAKRISNEIGMLDLDRLFERFPRLKFVDELAHRHRFHHWELVFADQFHGEASDGRVRGGFDLVLGNPPWGEGGVGGTRRSR